MVNGYPDKLPAYESRATGKHIFWFCKSPKTDTVSSEGFSCLHAVCDPVKLSESIYAISRASAKVSTANALWTAHIGFKCSDVIEEQTPRGALCRERREVIGNHLKEWSK